MFQTQAGVKTAENAKSGFPASCLQNNYSVSICPSWATSTNPHHTAYRRIYQHFGQIYENRTFLKHRCIDSGSLFDFDTMKRWERDGNDRGPGPYFQTCLPIVVQADGSYMLLALYNRNGWLGVKHQVTYLPICYLVSNWILTSCLPYRATRISPTCKQGRVGKAIKRDN